MICTIISCIEKISIKKHEEKQRGAEHSQQVFEMILIVPANQQEFVKGWTFSPDSMLFFAIL